MDFATSPVVAGAFGAGVGVGLLVLTKRASRLVVPSDPAIGMAKMLATIFGGLLVAIAALAILFLYARPSLAPFGLAMAASFLVVATYELFRFGGPAAMSGPRR